MRLGALVFLRLFGRIDFKIYKNEHNTTILPNDSKRLQEQRNTSAGMFSPAFNPFPPKGLSFDE